MTNSIVSTGMQTSAQGDGNDPQGPQVRTARGQNPVLRALEVIGKGFRTVWEVPKARFGLILLALIVLSALFAPWLSPYDPKAGDFEASIGPSAQHWLGTTSNGQDVLSQLLWGGRVSVMVAMVSGLLSTCIAVLVGLSWVQLPGGRPPPLPGCDQPGLSPDAGHLPDDHHQRAGGQLHRGHSLRGP